MIFFYQQSVHSFSQFISLIYFTFSSQYDIITSHHITSQYRFDRFLFIFSFSFAYYSLPICLSPFIILSLSLAAHHFTLPIMPDVLRTVFPHHQQHMKSEHPFYSGNTTHLRRETEYSAMLKIPKNCN